MLQCQLKVNNKVDVFNPLLNGGSWCIGTIKSNKRNEVIEVQIDGTHATDSKSLLRISDKIEHQQREFERYRYDSLDIACDLNWVWLQPTTIEDSIALLNTHTLKHYYLYSPSASTCTQYKKSKQCCVCGTKCCSICNVYSTKEAHYCIQCVSETEEAIIDSHDKRTLCCMICKSWLVSNNKHTCCRCRTVYCAACGITNDKSRFCIKCEVEIKAKKYAKSIRNAIGYDVGMDINNLITAFCMGHIIYCNNIKCFNTISINNQTELENGIDSEGNKIYQYKVGRVFATAFYDDCTCFLYGKVRRVFCSQCTESKLNRCVWGSVSHWETTPEQFKCNNYDVTHCCKNHAYCGYQAYYWKYARDNTAHTRPPCDYDVDLWINTDGEIKRCKWCYDKREILETYMDSYYSDYYDYCYLYDYDVHRRSSDDELAQTKRYNQSKDIHRKRYSFLAGDRMKNKRNKKGYYRVWRERTKKRQKRKSFMKRRNDKKRRCESNMRFKKRYQLSLQY